MARRVSINSGARTGVAETGTGRTMLKKIIKNQQVMAWALYDWANSAFATTVMAGFFPIFFKKFWASNLSAGDSTFYLGLGNSSASVLILLLAPIIGAIGDRCLIRKRLLVLFAILGSVMTALLYVVPQGAWQAALTLYTVAIFGFMAANVFYDALLVSVCDAEQRELVSSLGYALGYLGGGLLFTINVLMTLQPAWFGIADAGEAVKLSFLSVAIWWLFFTLPLMRALRERQRLAVNKMSIVRALSRFRVNVVRILNHRVLALFLLAYWFYIDGLDTIIRMAVDYGMALGMSQSSLITALIITQFVGFPATLIIGRLVASTKIINGLYFGIAAYIVMVVFSFFMNSTWEFYLLAVGIGLVQGSVQALSRAYYAGLVPEKQVAAYFGFYNMMGKSAVILGPLLIGGVVLISDSHRWGMLSVSLLFIIGLWLLRRVDALSKLGNT